MLLMWFNIFLFFTFRKLSGQVMGSSDIKEVKTMNYNFVKELYYQHFSLPSAYPIIRVAGEVQIKMKNRAEVFIK